MDILYTDISLAIDAGNLTKAQELIDALEAKNGATATTLYLRGNVALKQSRWNDAITLYSQSEAIDAEGPAREARLMLDDIMCFYNKDLYNP